VPFYREALDAHGVRPEDIRGPEDLALLPFTFKHDIQEHFPWGLCAVQPHEVARVHSSSGSTGNPINVCYTARDLQLWGDTIARGLGIAGVVPGDTCQIAFKYTLFTGAFGHHLGAERLGATIIPTSSGQTERQLLMMRSLGTTVLHSTPSYALVIAEAAERMGYGPDDLPLRLGIHGAEPMTDALRDEVQRRLGLRVARDYGLTELGGPGVSIECPAQAGYHIAEDHFFPEVVDPATGEPLADGQIGELVFTTLTKEASPVLRYRTRDLASLSREPCACGCPLARHSLILGRTDDMLIVGGVNFFPTQVEGVVCSFVETGPHYLIKLCTIDRRDRVTVQVEAAPHYWAECGGSPADELRIRLQRRVTEVLGFRVEVELCEPFSLTRTEGKSKRVLDEREP